MSSVQRLSRWCDRAAGILLPVLAAACLAPVPAFAAPVADACAGPLPAGQLRLRVSVEGVKSAKGNVTVTVYADDERQFLAKGGKSARQRVPAKTPRTEACFQLPVAAHYAVAVYHDANNDRDFNRNLLGLPAEGYGFSRDPESLIGLPKLEQVRFPTLSGADTPVTIRLKY